MPMREGCKFYESRTYPSGDSVRKCDLDLAPEAPWRCPDDCPAYTPRLADVNWSHGSLVTPPTPPEPSGVGTDPSIASLLDEAEDIINAAVEMTLTDIDNDNAGSRSRGAGASVREMFARIRRRTGRQR